MKKIIFVLLASCTWLASNSQTINDTLRLRQAINLYIQPNGTNQINAAQLNRILNGVINVLPAVGDGAYGVSSWKGRLGAVVPISGDYSIGMISGGLDSIRKRIDSLWISGTTLYVKKVGITYSIPITQSNIIGLVDSLADHTERIFDSTADLRTLANTKLSITDAASTYLPLSQKAAANGVAPLGADTKVPSSYLPAITMNRPWPVASEADMLDLDSAVIGDVAIRSDTAAAFILSDTDPSVLANWLPLPNSLPPVSSVNGKVGSVTLFTGDITESGSNYWWTAARSRAAQSLTTTGSSGAATYDNSTGILNVPTYTLAGLGGKAANDSSGLTGYATNRRLDSLAQKKVDLQIGNINAVAQTGGIHTTDSVISDATIHGQYLHTYGVRISDGTYISNIRPSVSYTANRVIDIPDRSGKLPLLQSGDINISSQTGGIHVTDTIQTNGPVISNALIASTSNPSGTLLNLSQSGNSLTWGTGGLINNQTTTLGGTVTIEGKTTSDDSVVTSSGMRASAFVGGSGSFTTSVAGFAGTFVNNNGAGDANGLLNSAGTTSSEYNAKFTNTDGSITFMAIKGNGKVGIGTNSPSEILDIVGNLKSSGSGTFGNTVTITNGSSVVGQLKLGQTQIGGKTWELQSYTDGGLYINNQAGSAIVRFDDNLTTTFNGSVAIAGHGEFNGPVILQAPETNTIYPGSGPNASLIGKDAYWAIRSNTSHEFALDVYNGGSPINAFLISQTGSIYAPSLASATTSNVVYYNSSNGKLTYGAAPGNSTRYAVNTLATSSYNLDPVVDYYIMCISSSYATAVLPSVASAGTGKKYVFAVGNTSGAVTMTIQTSSSQHIYGPSGDMGTSITIAVSASNKTNTIALFNDGFNWIVESGVPNSTN